MWQRIAGFTGPESQNARKAVAKKWKDKLKPVRQKWIDGAAKHFGVALATEWWDERMETFGRYAFNKSHAVSYCLWAYRCLWLKAHFPEEWWACVMGFCNQDKLERYMSSARADDVVFGEVDVNRLTVRPVAHAGINQVGDTPKVALGLISLKKVGESLSSEFEDTEEHNKITDIDEFVKLKGKQKILLERLIKLGAFREVHPNIKATWRWYLHTYCSGRINRYAELGDEPLWSCDDDGDFVQDEPPTDPKDRAKEQILITQLKNHHRIQLLIADGWNKASIEEERNRQVSEYKKLYPKRKNVPKKVLNWQPDPKDTRERVMGLYSDDYDLTEVLEFEKEFLGYYWHSPCDLYKISPGTDIEHAKITGRLEGVITKKYEGRTRNDKPMLKLVITDGRQECLVILWQNEMGLQDDELLVVDSGIRLKVQYDPDRNSFTLERGSIIGRLWSKKGWEEQHEGALDQ